MTLKNLWDSCSDASFNSTTPKKIRKKRMVKAQLRYYSRKKALKLMRGE